MTEEETAHYAEAFYFLKGALHKIVNIFHNKRA